MPAYQSIITNLKLQMLAKEGHQQHKDFYKNATEINPPKIKQQHVWKYVSLLFTINRV